MTTASTIDPEEIAHFSRMAEEWWDEHGKFAPLHRINPLRIAWIQEHVSLAAAPSVLDIGCGGGLIAEPIARLGARVTAIDASEKNIAVATLHAAQAGVSVQYACSSVEQLDANVPDAPAVFDAVLALEIIEHVADVDAFVAASCARVKPGGLIFYSTLNRTAKAYALAIIGAEYVLRWLPKGTHHWHKFIKPHELVRALERNGVEVVELRGMVMHPLTFQWRWEPGDLSVNYALVGRKVRS